MLADIGVRGLKFAAAAASVAVTGLVVTHSGFALMAALLLVAVLLVLALRRRLAPIMLSPVLLVSVSYLLLGVAGGVLYARLRRADSGASLAVQLSPEEGRLTGVLLVSASVSVLVGALAFVVIVGAGRNDHSGRLLGPVRLSAAAQQFLMAGAAIPLTIVVAGYGLPELWARSDYIPAPVRDRPLFSVGVQLSTAAVLVLGYLFATRRDLVSRIYVVGLSSAYALMLFALGTRRLSLVPLLFTLGMYSSRPHSRRSKALLLFGLLVSVLMVQVPLFLRTQLSHGLLPYVSSLPGIFESSIGIDSSLLSIFVSYGVIGATAFQQPTIGMAALWTSVNPLPGGPAGWYQLAPALRFNEATPYAAIGELANVGWAVVIAYFLVVGFVLAYLDTRIRTLLRSGEQVYGLALVAMGALFLLFSVQYNLRAATRMLYYAIALDIVLRLWGALRVSRSASAGSKGLAESAKHGASELN